MYIFLSESSPPTLRSNPFSTSSARKTRGHFLVGECCWHVAAAFYIFTSLTWFPLPNECIECSESQKLTASSDRTENRVPGTVLGFKFKYLDMERLNKRNSIYDKQNHNPSIIHQEANTCREPGTEWNGRNFIDTPTCTPRYRYNGSYLMRICTGGWDFGGLYWAAAWGPLVPGLFFISFYIFCYACKAQIPSV